MASRGVGYPPASIATLHPDRYTQPYWDAVKEHRLVCQQCSKCGTFRTPPGPYCHVCQSPDFVYTELSGKGRVYTYTVVMNSQFPDFADSVPFVVAVIELDDAPGARLFSNVVNIDPAKVTIGMPVRVVYDDVSDTVSIPRFEPT
jgi:uncharacterized OB-fold protein